MGIGYEDFCVGCPQGCIHCGRKSVLVVSCDYCGDESGDYDDYFWTAGNHVSCKRCIVEEMVKSGEVTEIPFAEDDECYLYDGDKYSYDTLVEELTYSLRGIMDE